MSYFDKIKWLTVPRPLKLERPKVIQFPVIDICNSRCQMCRIWENKKSDDISVDALMRGLSNNLFSKVTGIGFNGGEPTLRKDLSDLVLVAIKALPNLKNISLITNAYNYQEVIRQVERIGLLCQEYNKNFDLMISLDGYGAIHDLVRGKEGNFDRAQHVISYAKGSNLVNNLRVGCTIIRENAYYLADLLDFCIENDIYIKYRLGVPHQRLYTSDLKEPYALTDDERYSVIEFLQGLIKHYEKGYLQKHFYKSLIGQLTYNSPRRAGCDWQHRGVTITAKGELAYCAVKSKVLMDDISIGDPELAYFSNQEHLNDIIKKSCSSCSHDYVGLPNRRDYLRYVIYTLDSRFGLKAKIRSIPGFAFLQSFRQERSFKRNYDNFAKLPDAIKLVSHGGVTKRVMICGWYGTETLGDKAIVAGVLDALQSIFDGGVKCTIVSLFPYVTEITKSQMKELDGVDVVSVETAVSTVANYDYLIFGGGPIMAINELALMQVLFEKAKKARVINIAAGVGVGPLGKKWLNDSIAVILNLCDVKIYRDRKSLDIASSLGVDVSFDYVAEDPALTWIKKIKAEKVENGGLAKKEKVLLLGLREFPYREYASGISESESIKISHNYEASIVKALEAFVAQDSEWKITPLPMCSNHFGDDDRWFYRRLFRGNKKLSRFLDYSLLNQEFAPADYIKYFKNADVLLGMRFHSLVFGLGLGVKTVAIDYTMGKGKVSALSDRFGLVALSMIELNPDSVLSALTRASVGDMNQDFSVCENITFRETLKRSLQAGNFL